jgi:hypothetical protein
MSAAVADTMIMRCAYRAVALARVNGSAARCFIPMMIQMTSPTTATGINTARTNTIAPPDEVSSAAGAALR